MVQSEEQRVKWCRRVSWTSGTCGTTTNSLLYMSLEPQNQKEAERSHLQETCTIRNATRYHSGTKQMILKCKDQSRDHVMLKQQQKISWSRQKIFQTSSPNNIQGNQNHNPQQYTPKYFHKFFYIPPLKRWRPVPFPLRMSRTRWLILTGQNIVEVTVEDFQG